nr:hypothetical protein 1 [Nakaseomyces glabratus]
MPLTLWLRDSTLWPATRLCSISPLQSFNSLILFSTLSIFWFRTQMTFSLPLVYCARTSGWPDLFTTSNCMCGSLAASMSSLRDLRNALIPAEDPPQLQYCSTTFLQGCTNAPTPFRAMEFLAIALTTIYIYVYVYVYL